MSDVKPIARLLIANRGEIAVRIARTARRMGIETVAIFSDADAGAPHVLAADSAVRVGPAAPSESYANAAAVLEAARATGADALHPGYGFLAENADFAEACAAAGITFVGPTPQTMRALGDKSTAKRLLAETPVPMLLGYDGADQRDETLHKAADALSTPLMIKASAGGGGRGMRLVTDLTQFPVALASARSEALASFGSADVLLERALIAPRHIEVQIFGDRHGAIVHLGERDCSIQRRHQKLIEESPSPIVDLKLRENLVEAALTVAHVVGYENAGTVEFLVDDDGSFFFIEVNARLQVEHPVTEAVTGLDLVEWQLRVAMGEPLPLAQEEIRFHGHAIEARLCAEDPAHDFLPQAGTLARWVPNEANVRVDHALASGIAISPNYDSMIAKFIAHGRTRDEARTLLAGALASTVAFGIPTNREALAGLLRSEAFAHGKATTAFVASFTEALPTEADPRDLALAAALRYRASLSASDYGEFGGWSTTTHPGASVRLAPRGGGDATSLVASGVAASVRVTTADRAFELAFETPAAGPDPAKARVSIDGAPWETVDTLVTDDAVEFARGGATRAYTVLGVTSVQGGAAALDGLLRAPMSGRVVRIDAALGDRTAADAALVVLEAMKMEHHLTLPAAVTVTGIETEIGQQVSAGQILIAYDTAPSS